ncbi:MAG: ankyrin repeat domain-containing protein [Rivularia sp. (in: Bacteria)]|nr:ankyrin repeat domain-containing protein [Rivularia sp. MS3]
MSDFNFFGRVSRIIIVGICLGSIKLVPTNSQTKLTKVCESTAILQKYLKDGGNPDARFKNTGGFESRNYPDNYPLLFCVSNEGAEILLKNGANPNVQFAGKTLLYRAYRIRNTSLIQLLLKHGANPNALTSYNDTSLLHQAVANGDVKMVKLLLKSSADVNIKNSRKATPLDVAIRRAQAETAEILMEKGGITNLESGSKRFRLLRKKINKLKIKRYRSRLRQIKQRKKSKF